jgi:ketosteroid isomerase-like protein
VPPRHTHSGSTIPPQASRRLADGTPDFAAPAPRTADDGRPDFSGIWVMVSDIDIDFSQGMPLASEFVNIGASLPEGLPYQPWAADLVAATRANGRLMDPLSHCLPIGLVRSHTFTMYREIVQVPGQLVVLNEHNASFRQIFTDDRPLPIDPQPSWNGYSSARWDGDTLIVQTIGFRDGIWLDAFASPLTSAARIVERIRRPTLGELQVELTIDDPNAYTRPWTVTLRQKLVADTQLMDHICLENERSVARMLAVRAQEDARVTLATFIDAIETADLERLLSTFHDSATVFLRARAPGELPVRVSGISDLRAVFTALFARRQEPVTITPRDAAVDVWGEVAVVTTHLGGRSTDSIGRRTFVLHKTGDRWLIVHYHASDVPLNSP